MENPEMGWSSANEIFNPVALALIELDAPTETKRKVLGTLIAKLQDGDWDTEDESLTEFAYDPVIVSLFYAAGVGNQIDGIEVDGLLDFDVDAEQWTLVCRGRTGCDLLERADNTKAGHDALVRAWAAHEQERHGGDGEVAEHMLIEGAVAHWIVPS